LNFFDNIFKNFFCKFQVDLFFKKRRVKDERIKYTFHIAKVSIDAVSKVFRNFLRNLDTVG